MATNTDDIATNKILVDDLPVHAQNEIKRVDEQDKIAKENQPKKTSSASLQSGVATRGKTLSSLPTDLSNFLCSVIPASGPKGARWTLDSDIDEVIELAISDNPLDPPEKYSPLTYCMRFSFVASMETLLQNGANVNQKIGGKTPFASYINAYDMIHINRGDISVEPDIRVQVLEDHDGADYLGSDLYFGNPSYTTVYGEKDPERYLNFIFGKPTWLSRRIRAAIYHKWYEASQSIPSVIVTGISVPPDIANIIFNYSGYSIKHILADPKGLAFSDALLNRSEYFGSGHQSSIFEFQCKESYGIVQQERESRNFKTRLLKCEKTMEAQQRENAKLSAQVAQLTAEVTQLKAQVSSSASPLVQFSWNRNSVTSSSAPTFTTMPQATPESDFEKNYLNLGF